jgi:hypothetical protein
MPAGDLVRSTRHGGKSMTIARDYIRTVELPVPPAPKRDREKAATFGSDQQAVVVASQMAEFTPAVPKATRPVLGNGLLLGQLAADKAAGETGDIFRWYDAYGLAMRKIGWLLQDIDFDDRQMTQTDLNVHKAIIPVLATILGMNAQGGKFQMSYVDAGPGGGVTLKTAFFGVDAQRTVTQVLFFRFSGQAARLKSATSEMTLGADLLDDVATPLQEKVAPFVVANIKNIEI